MTSGLKRILYDLKPALDGYAGIPQETRLLFRQLRRLGPPFEIDGLLQHEHETLFAGTQAEKDLSPDQRIDQASRTVVSFFGAPLGGRLHRYMRKLRQYRTLVALRWHALTGRVIDLGTFEAAAFQDFIWTCLFAKTLQIEDRHSVTSGGYRIVPPPRGMMHLAGLGGLTRLNTPRYPVIDTTEYDFLVAQTPFPAHVSPNTQLVVRYHDAMPIFMPHTIGAKKFHQASHFRALRSNVDDGAIFACNSEATRKDLLAIFPRLEDRAVVIYNLVSDHFQSVAGPERASGTIIANRATGTSAQPSQPEEISESYLLMVSTLEPRKNHDLLISAWERIRSGGMPDLALVLVGNKGWHFEAIEDRIRPWIDRKKLFHLTNVPSHELQTLYREAAATICPSRGEGFDYSGIEAMRSGGLVISSDIAVHKEIYGAGSAYFDSYSAVDAAATIARILGSGAEDERLALRRAAAEICSRYDSDTILSKWQSLFAQQTNDARNRPY